MEARTTCVQSFILLIWLVQNGQRELGLMACDLKKVLHNEPASGVSVVIVGELYL